jgi:hypothetical protein
MRTAAVLLAILAVSCSQAAAPVANSATPTPSASHTPTPSASQQVSPTPPGLPLTTVAFSCKLPITTQENQGAFVTFPAGTVTIDPQAQRMIGSAWGLYYDRAFSRWLPVPRQAVSADGKHYAYGERAADQSQVAKMHVVDIATGADHVFATPSTAWFIPYSVLDYAGEGIYLSVNYEGSYGVSLMDPQTGAVHSVARLPDIQASAGNQTFWVGSVNPADPSPLGGIGMQANQIDRYSLVDGSRVAWFYRPSTAPRVVGSDIQGHPIVWLVTGSNGVIDGDSVAELLLLMDPKSQRTIFKDSSKLLGENVQSISDSHGTWFGSDHGIYLDTGSAFMRVSNQPGYPANGCF